MLQAITLLNAIDELSEPTGIIKVIFLFNTRVLPILIFDYDLGYFLFPSCASHLRFIYVGLRLRVEMKSFYHFFYSFLFFLVGVYHMFPLSLFISYLITDFIIKLTMALRRIKK